MLIRYFNERLVTSPRQRMARRRPRGAALAGAAAHPADARAPQFEALLLEIAEYAEEWLTSAQAMGLAQRRTTGRVLPWDPGRAAAPAMAGAAGNGRG